MGLYVLVCIDKPGALELRRATRAAHLAYAGEHRAMLRLAGPFLDEAGEMAGSLFILEADDLAAAQAFHAADPYRLAGLFERVEIRPWRATVGEVP
ncbi:MAG TPA: YciI family protein [Caulobacteraceae bacterium]|nr:YciI family protein [Caulobacteraceae bacterium]